MKFLKRWIVKIFKIQIKDVPEKEKTIHQSHALDQKSQEIINDHITLQLQKMIEGIVIPELRKSVVEEIERLGLTRQIEGTDSSYSENELLNKSDVSQTEPVQSNDKTEETENIDTGISFQDEMKTEQAAISEIKDEPPSFSQSKISLELEAEVDNTQKVTESTQPVVATNDKIDLEKDAQACSTDKSQFTDLRQEIRLGIDFGTTTTSISVKIGDNPPEAVPIGNNGANLFIPSMVYIQPGAGKIIDRAIVGEDAEAYGDQERIIRSVKRCFGCQGEKCNQNQENNLRNSSYPFPLCKGDGLIYIGDKETIKPSEIAYLIIREALKRTIKILIEKKGVNLIKEDLSIYPINLGCGAQFNYHQRKIIMDVAKDLGFSKVTIDNIVEEPVLAGFTFARFAENPEGRILIYDFGGGTFDVAVLEVDRIYNQDIRVTVLATAGENWLGGDDIDVLVYNHFIKQIADSLKIQFGEINDVLDSIERNKLLNRSRMVKEFLSYNDNYFDSLFIQGLNPIDIELSRSEFEQLLLESKFIENSIFAVERACRLVYVYEKAKDGFLLNAKDITDHKLHDAAINIDKVILIGGITKIPLIRNKLSEIFSSEKIVKDTVIEPISSVAVGAAYPRDSQHYSISVPPYGFYLESEDSDGDNKKYETILFPFEYHDFHRFWHISSLSTFTKELRFLNDKFSTKIVAKNAGQMKSLWSRKLGNLKAGDWLFSITPEGTIYFYKKGEKPVPFDDFPLLHPVQIAICEAREKKYKEEQESKKSDNDLFSDIRSMMNEN